jgi:hypothetical protein
MDEKRGRDTRGGKKGSGVGAHTKKQQSMPRLSALLTTLHGMSRIFLTPS